MNKSYFFGRLTGSMLLLVAVLSQSPAQDSGQIPTICVASVEGSSVIVVAHVRAGFNSVMLEARPDAGEGAWQGHVSGTLNGSEGMVVFTAPSPGPNAVYRVRADTQPPTAAAFSGPQHFAVTYGIDSCLFTEDERIGHVLNRLAYGTGEYELQRVAAIGLENWIEEQLNPSVIDEDSNTALNSRLAELFYSFQPAEEIEWVRSGDEVRYFKGSSDPGAGWETSAYNDANWLAGRSGVGYGDDDDATELEDMPFIEGVQPGYSTVFVRKWFTAKDAAQMDELVLRINFDDGFVAYLNGVEVARSNVTGVVSHTGFADSNHEANGHEDFDITSHKGLIQDGANLLSVVGFNVSLDSSDFSLDPEMIGRRYLEGMPLQMRMAGIDELQEVVHLRGVYARRQLEAVLGEFWENHFTTDYDKVQDYFDDLDNSDGSDAMSDAQARLEAAHAEWMEHDFFHSNALGYFGDLLLYSATSPAQLIYLDNVLNVKGAANENYAREILELFAFGVDNRYTQADIEELARCFTGWTIRKVWPDEWPAYPDSARNPPTDVSVQFADTVVVDVGAGWKFFRGTQEPTPNASLEPTTTWTNPTYEDSGWENGATPIGYGSVGYGTSGYYGTELTDMRRTGTEGEVGYNPGYASVYLRRSFTVEDLDQLTNPVLAVSADDGFVAYLNGVEVARTRNLEETGEPPSFDQLTNGSGREPIEDQVFSLNAYKDLFLPAPQQNVLAVQLHNTTFNSSDAAVVPRLIERTKLPGSIENGDANGLWTFRFSPDDHDTDPKTLFEGTPYQMDIPGGRVGLEGLSDAVDVIDAMESHPSTAEFICLKLVNRFVSDEISLGTYQDRTAPAELVELMDNAIAAWNSEVNGRKGHIGTVMRAIIDPIARVNVFWGEAGYKTKIKTPVEYINSTLRAVNSQIDPDNGLPNWNESLGMRLFTRDEPNGWSEIGLDWMDAGTLIERVQFSRMIAGNSNNDYQWDTATWIAENNITSALDVIAHFNERLFQNSLSADHIAVLEEFGNSTLNGPSVLDPTNTNHHGRVRELVGLILSLPHWQYQ